MTKMMTTQKQIMMICDGMKELLLEKNKRYEMQQFTREKSFIKAMLKTLSWSVLTTKYHVSKTIQHPSHELTTFVT